VRVFSRIAMPAVLMVCVLLLGSCGRLGPREVKLSELSKERDFNCKLRVARKGAGDIVEAKFYINPRAALIVEGGEVLVNSNDQPVLVLAPNKVNAPDACLLTAFQLGETTEVGPLPSYHTDKNAKVRNDFSFHSDTQTPEQRDALHKLMSNPRLGKRPVAPADLRAFQIAVWAVWNGNKAYTEPALKTLASKYTKPKAFEDADYDTALELLKHSGLTIDSGIVVTKPSGGPKTAPPHETQFSASDYEKVGDRLAREATTRYASQPTKQMEYLQKALWCYTRGAAQTKANQLTNDYGVGKAVEMPPMEVEKWLAKK
jgi:hypothetical protein